jgi:hypothetical protein
VVDLNERSLAVVAVARAVHAAAYEVHGRRQPQRRRRNHHRNDKINRYHAWRNAQGRRRTCMHTRIPKLIAEINTIIADHSNKDVAEEREAIDLLKRARHALSLARVKLQEADLKKSQVASG